MGNPWKIATIVIATVVTTALVTGLVVANLNGKDTPQPATQPGEAQAQGSKPVEAQPAPSPSSVPSRHAGTAPRRTSGSNSSDVIEKTLIGGGLGAGGAIAGGGKGAGKGAAIGGIVGATAGALYGLHDK